jgi:Lon protease-like protein
VDQWNNLPLFPLNTVLFPGMILPLHIFEERYKLMINHCLKQECPFGVVLIREGKEVGSGAVPYKVGTTAHIAKVSRLEEGRMNLVVIGVERFRLRSLQHDRPYLAGTADPWPLETAKSAELEKWVEPLRALFRQYLSLLALAEGHKIDVEDVPPEPRTLALLIAIALQLPMSQKQALLARSSVTSMLRAEWAIMRREQLILDYIIRTQEAQWEGGFSGYLANN